MSLVTFLRSNKCAIIANFIEQEAKLQDLNVKILSLLHQIVIGDPKLTIWIHV